ncbi:hypothetical protein ACLQ3C_03740 [Gordonia sp. DT30]
MPRIFPSPPARLPELDGPALEGICMLTVDLVVRSSTVRQVHA